MNVLVNLVGHVVVDDVLDQRDVQTPPSHGGCHQDWIFAGSEICQSLFSLALGSVPMDADGGKSLTGEVGSQVVSGGFFLEDKKTLRQSTLQL